MTKNAVAKAWAAVLGETEGGTYNSVDMGDPPAVSLAVSGTLSGSTEVEKAASSQTTILVTTGATWIAAGAAFNAERRAILDAQTANATPVPTFGWNNEVRDKEPVTSVVRTDDNTVTIIWSAAPAFDIAVSSEVSHRAPASALSDSDVDIVGSIDSTITAVIAGMSIISATGTKSDGSAITLAGSGFGTKTAAAPELDDRIDNIASYSALNDGDTIPVGGSNPWDTNSNTNNFVKFDDNVGRQRHVRSTAQYKATNQKGAHMDDFEWVTKTDQIHVSWWFYGTEDFAGVDKDTHSSKFIRLSASDETINETLSWTQRQLILFDNPVFPFNKFKDTFGSAAPVDTWNFFEVLINFADETVKAMVNNVAIYNGPFVLSTTMQFNKIYRIGWESGGDDSFPMDWRMSDIFADSIFSRARLGDASTEVACTFFEEQPASAWADDEIDIILKRGQHSTGTAWLYVVAADGNVTPGFPITIVD